ncbi:MAG TPA: LacI family DNA-binding transcriptional regulator [Candidatus Dormibacteraeota bacterium]|nr:LacI family DNA-binding transcriptional regulator [Candidatus Dormibacteraeota bacterium]
MNIREIASRAKVSVATVSRIINRVPTVDPVLSKRVRRVIHEAGYHPNPHARALASGRTRTVGLIVSEIRGGNPFVTELIQHFEECASRNGYGMLVSFATQSFDSQRIAESLRRVREHRVDAVAIMTFGMEELLLDRLEVKNTPLVFVDVGPAVPRVSNISIDYMTGIRQAVQHLVALGHRKIAYLTGELRLSTLRERRNAFVKCITELGLRQDSKLIIEEEHSMQGGKRAIAGLLRTEKRVSAVMCCNDAAAIGAIHQIVESGLRVPEDISVVGFDDIPLAQFTTPPLTTVRLSQEELARLAFNALLADLERKKPIENGVRYPLQTQLIIRNSTALVSRGRSHRNGMRNGA